MKSLLIMATVATAAIALAGCRDKKPEPVPGPQSAGLEHHAAADSNCPEARAHRGVSEISWFQGTLEEAFASRASRHAPKPARPLIHY